MDLTSKKTMTSPTRLLKSIFTLFLLGLSVWGTAQNFRYPVVARITQTAPYPIFLQDYANPSQNIFSIQLEVRDNSLPIRNVQLKLYISGPAGIIQSTPFVRNERVIELAAGQFYDLPAPDVANYFRNFNLQILPQQYSQPLVDGTYQFGVEVIDALTNQPLSGIQYAPPVWIVVNDPPVLFTPTNESVVSASDSKNLIFQWIPRHKNVSDVSYEFSITELNVPLDYNGNIQNLFLSQPPIYTERTEQTQLNYDFSLPPLIPGKIYAYRVRAIAKNGLEEIGMFRNNGFSEIQWFRYLPELLPPYNVNVERLGEEQLALNWDGYENQTQFVLNYRQKGKTTWNENYIPRADAEVSKNSFEEAYDNFDSGNYEFRIGAFAEYYPQPVFSEILYLKDSLSSPYNIRSEWKDSTSAFVRWYGNQAHWSYRLEYKTVLGDDTWKQIIFENAEEASLSEEFFEFGTFVEGVSSDSSYAIRLVGIDYDKEETTSRENYLVKKEMREELLKLKEKTILGNISWAFLRSEEEIKAVSGSLSFLENPFLENPFLLFRKPDPRLMSNSQEVGFDRQPLEHAKIDMFADSTCTILIKSIEGNEFGNFKLNFPIEALRGGQIPSIVYLRFKDNAFGTFIKAVRTDFAADDFDIGNWVVSARSFRLRPLILPRGTWKGQMEEHKITLYRRATDLEAAPYLKHEHFGKANTTIVEINNEEYYRVGELTTGQVAAGLFSTVVERRQEFLLKYEGPVPYQVYYQKETFEPKDGVWQHDVIIVPILGNPFIYGTVTSLNGILNASDVRLELFNEGNLIETTFPSSDTNYRVNIPLSSYKADALYNLKVFYQNTLAQEITVSLNPKELGTLLDIKLRANDQVAIILNLKDANGDGIDGATVKIGGKSYQTAWNGWVTLVAGEGTTTPIEITRTGFPTIQKTINVNAEQKTAFTPIVKISKNDDDLKNAIRKDIDDLVTKSPAVQSQLQANQTLRRRLTSKIHEQLFELEHRSSIRMYGGVMAVEIFDDSKPNPFDLNIKVIDKFTKQPISGVIINEESIITEVTEDGVLTKNILDIVGETNAAGIVTYKSHVGRGQKTFQISPKNGTTDTNGNEYGKANFAFNFPALNSTSKSGTVTVELESGALITGVVYKIGTNIPIPNAEVNIEFPGLDTYVTTNDAGVYQYRFNATREENFVTLTTTAEGYAKRAVYIATSLSYGTLYERDIYLRGGAPEEELEEETIDGFTVGISMNLYGYRVRNITAISSGEESFTVTEFKRSVLRQPQNQPWLFTISGEFLDNQGRLFSFEGAQVTFKPKQSPINNNVYNLFLHEIISLAIPLTTRKENRKFFETIKVAESEPLYLGPLYMNGYPVVTSRTNKGVIYFNNLTLDPSESEDIRHIMAGAKVDGGRFDFKYSDLMANFQAYTRIDERYGRRQFVISCSETDNPIISMEVFSGKDYDENHYQNIRNYYEGNQQSRGKLSSNKLLGARSNTGMYYYNNVLFKSFSITEKGPQINKVAVMPVISIENIKIDLMNIDFVRLSDNKVKDILIDYSYSPRTLSMGEDVVKAQIEEVYVEEEGVDVVYFTNDGLNLIDLKSPDMTPINYNANGIFYSDYQNQKEIVQTAAVLNTVEMYQIPEPAMGPGFRIKVSSLIGMAAEGTGYYQKVLENTPKYAYNGEIIPLSWNPNETETNELKLEGDGDIVMDPHVLKTFWKYDDKKEEWDVKLKSFTSLSQVWGNIYRPNSIQVKVGDKDDVSLLETELPGGATHPVKNVDFANLKGAELQVNYGIAIPVLGSFEMVCEAKYDQEKLKFVRSTITGQVEVTVPQVIEAKIGVAILLDTSEKVSGIFFSGEATVEAIGYGGSLAGGYACVASEKNPGKCDMIVGGQIGISSEEGTGKKVTADSVANNATQSAFKLYGAKIGYLYDQATDASFLLASASLGIGKQGKFDAELLQVLPDSKEDSTAKSKTKNEKAQKLQDLENVKSETERNQDKFNADNEVTNKENNLMGAKAEKTSKKSALDAARTVKNDASNDYNKKKAKKDEAENKVNRLERDGGNLTQRNTAKNNAVTALSTATQRKTNADQDLNLKDTKRSEAINAATSAGLEVNTQKAAKEQAKKDLDLAKEDESLSEQDIEDIRQAYITAKDKYNTSVDSLNKKLTLRNNANKEYEEAIDEVEKAKNDVKKQEGKVVKAENAITKLTDAQAELSTASNEFTTAESAKTTAESTFSTANSNYETSKTAVETANSELTDANAAAQAAENAIKEFATAKKGSVSANNAYSEALNRRKNIDSTDAALKKRYKHSDPTAYKGGQKFALETLFVVATGRSPFDPLEHKFTVNDGELTISSGQNGTTISGAGEFGIKGQPLFEIGLMLSIGSQNEDPANAGFRVFIAMPSFYVPKVGPVEDLTINAQLEFGNAKYTEEAAGDTTERADFFLMGSVEGTVAVHPVVYVNVNARFVLAINASTDQEALENRIAAGANLSETARKIVKFFGSSFNTIAEEAINQRMSFFGAVPEQYLVNKTFTGFYLGAKASVLAGRTKDFDQSFFAGSLRAGVGIELGLGLLKSLGTDSWEFRLGLNPIIELTVRMRSPIEDILIDERIDNLLKFCMAVGYNAVTDEHYYNFIFSIIQSDRMIGESITPAKEVMCNSFGVLYVKPCISVFFRYKSESEGEEGEEDVNGFFIDTVLEENPMEEICPIEW